MESSGATPRGAIDCSDLSEIFGPAGPVLTVYLETEPVPNAAQLSQQKWQTLRRDLEEAGATAEALDAVESLVPDAHTRGRCLSAVVTKDGQVLHQGNHPDPPQRDLGRWDALPSLVPVVEWRQTRPPHVIVLTDRTGADIFVFEALGGRDFQIEVEGSDDVIRKVAPGGWSQRRFQQRAEDSWEANAKVVADRLVRIVEKIDARLIVAAGDVRALQLLREALPPQVDALVEEVEGSRSPDGSVDAIAADTVTLVATAVARDTSELIAKFREEVGQADRAANGPDEVVAALCEGRVDVLLIHDDPEDRRVAYVGPAGSHVALEPGPLKEMGVDAPAEARLPDALLRAAVGTSARVRVVPAASVLDNGVGAILRW
jgi:peptide subunit release factor 1 (eRF1)